MWLDQKIKEMLETASGGGNYLAVEIGNTHLTVAEFSKNKGEERKMLSIETVDLPYSSDDGVGENAVSAMDKIVKDKSIKARRVFLAIPDWCTFARYIRLPPISKEKIPLLVKYEAQQNVPFPIDDVAWDYHLFNSDKLNAGDISLVLVAVKKDWLHSLIGEMKSSGYKVISAEPSSVAMGNFLLYEILLTGGGAAIEGLEEFLSAKLNTPVTMLKGHSEFINVPSNNRMGRDIIATALTRKGLTDGEVVINLLGKQNGKIKKVVSKSKGVCALCPFRK